MKRTAFWLLVMGITLLFAAPLALTAEEEEGLVCSQCHAKVTEGKVVHPALDEGCDACHEIEPVENPKEGEPPHTRDTLENVNDLCNGCHDVPEDPEHVHPPIKEQGCTFCHNPHSAANDALLRLPPYDLCGKCHKETLPTTYATRHTPALKNCGLCHAVHGSNKDAYLKQQSPDLCLSCHQEVKHEVTSANPHPPAKEDCLNCHLSHASINAFLLNAYFPKGPYAYYTPIRYDLCWQCHDQDEVFGKDSGFQTALGKNLHKVHVAKKKGRVCTLCHSPHGSAQPKLLQAEIPFGPNGWVIPLQSKKTEKGGSCGPACHESRSYSH